MSGGIDLAGSGGASGSPNPGTPAVRIAGGGSGGTGSSLSEMTLRYLHERVEKKEEQILKIEATVFQVANYNLVFQGMILAAITNGGGSSSSSSSSSSPPPPTCSSSAFRCDLSFLPMCLSAVGSILNFAVLWTNAAKYMDALEELDRRRLVRYKNQQPESPSTADDMEKRHGRSKGRRMLILVLSIILFAVFAALNLVATLMISCQ